MERKDPQDGGGQTGKIALGSAGSLALGSSWGRLSGRCLSHLEKGSGMAHHPMIRVRRLVLSTAVMFAGLVVPLSVAAAPPASATVSVTSHFIWTATSSNTTAFVSVINNAATNGLPNAMLFVTPNLSPGGICTCVTDPVQVGVVYNLLGSGKWAIFNEDFSNMPIGASFNVLVVQQPSKDVFVQTATPGNTGGGDFTTLNSKLTNGKPGAQMIVTPNYDPGGTNGAVDNHTIGLFFESNKWNVFNEDLAGMPLGVHFNVMIGATKSNGGQMVLQTATNSNISGDSTIIFNPQSTGNPNAVVFDTPNWNPGGLGGTSDTAATGVLYYQSPTDDAAVFNEDGSSMPVNAAFNVLIFPS
jgi:hypothetical protein